MRATIVLLLASGITAAKILASDTAGPADEARFERALRDESCLDYFVLVTIVDDRTGRRSTMATPAPFLLGAVHTEHRISYDKAGIEKATRLVLESKDREYHFSRQKAIKNVRLHYTPEVLAEVREAMAAMSDADLVNGAAPSEPLRRIYDRDPPRDANRGWRDRYKEWQAHLYAVAHVLLERGFQPRVNSCSGNLSIESERGRLP